MRDPYTIHHELMNRIATASTYAHLLKTEENPDDRREMMDDLIEIVNEANALGRELQEELKLSSPFDQPQP